MSSTDLRSGSLNTCTVFRAPGLVVVLDNIACRGVLVRELCKAMKVRAGHVADISHALTMIGRGTVEALVIDHDTFGQRALAEIAKCDVSVPILLTVPDVAGRMRDASAHIYALGLTQVTLISRPLTTVALRRFLTENGTLAAPGQPLGRPQYAA